MDNPKKGRQAIGLIIFFIGLLVGLFFNGLAIWGDLESMSFWGVYEAASYESEQEMDARLHNLSCPILITTQETAQISMSVSNKLDEPVEVLVQADISTPEDFSRIQSDRQEILLEPGEQRDFNWTARPEDRLYDQLILSRVYLYRGLQYGVARTDNCGILVIDPPGLSSNQIITFTAALSLIGLAAGYYLWFVSSWPHRQRGRHLAIGLALIGGTVVAGIIANLTGAFLVASALLVLTLVGMLSLFEILFLPK